jgi:hypothetical protein
MPGEMGVQSRPAAAEPARPLAPPSITITLPPHPNITLTPHTPHQAKDDRIRELRAAASSAVEGRAVGEAGARRELSELGAEAAAQRGRADRAEAELAAERGRCEALEAAEAEAGRRAADAADAARELEAGLGELEDQVGGGALLKGWGVGGPWARWAPEPG